MASALAVLLVALPSTAPAQDRPDEDELFGAPAAAPSDDAEAGRPGEAELFGPSTPQSVTVTPPAEREASADPLSLGGILYMRSVVGATRGQQPEAWSLALPTIVDGYLDARPNERVRGFVLARLQYDPTLASGAAAGGGDSTLGLDLGALAGGGGGGNPRMLLDQLWLRFDIDHRVFVTAGKQHVKWGTARFWNPTDFLHPVRRDPLAPFDVRTGVTMLKVHVPFEAQVANLYALAVIDDRGPVNRLGRVAGAARAEVALGTAELGADVVVRRGERPRLGVDASAGVGEVDLYVESALTSGDARRWHVTGPMTPAAPLGQYRDAATRLWKPSTTVGATWAWMYDDEDSLMLGAEYFYNAQGYDDPAIYPFLASEGDLTPFYLGRQYAGAYAVLMAPGSWNDTSFILSALGNLSDGTLLTRLDYQVLALTYLRVEAFAQGHVGKAGGELRFGVDRTVPIIDPSAPGGVRELRVRIEPPLFEVGLGLQVSL